MNYSDPSLKHNQDVSDSYFRNFNQNQGKIQPKHDQSSKFKSRYTRKHRIKVEDHTNGDSDYYSQSPLNKPSLVEQLQLFNHLQKRTQIDVRQFMNHNQQNNISRLKNSSQSNRQT